MSSVVDTDEPDAVRVDVVGSSIEFRVLLVSK